MSFITRLLRHTAVYWPKPTYDGFHKATYDSGYPVKITCWWDERKELYTDVEGNEKQSLAMVYTETALELGGFLFLGDLDDLDSAQDAQTQDGAYEIMRVDKQESISGRVTFYKVTL